MARKRRKAKLNLDKYAPDTSDLFFTDAEMRSEYTRLRKQALDRLRTLKHSKYGGTSYVMSKLTAFKPAKDYTNTQLRYKLYDVARFLNSPLSTVSGNEQVRKKSAKSLRREGYNIKDKDIENFGHFMESVRAKLQDRMYDSDLAARMYIQVVRHHIDPEVVLKNYREWTENIDALEYQQARGKREGSSAQILARAQKLQRKKFSD